MLVSWPQGRRRLDSLPSSRLPTPYFLPPADPLDAQLVVAEFLPGCVAHGSGPLAARWRDGCVRSAGRKLVRDGQVVSGDHGAVVRHADAVAGVAADRRGSLRGERASTL